MQEKLTIKNFGPIKDVTLDLKKVNVFIGDQGTGKSTVAKLINAIRRMSHGFLEGPLERGMLRRVDQFGKKEDFLSWLKNFGLENYLTDETIIFYKSINFEYSYSNEESTINPQNPVIDQGISFIPAERQIFSLLTTETLFALQRVEFKLPDYLSSFGQLFGRINKGKKEFDFTEQLNIKFIPEDGEYFIELENGKRISILESSSAIQSNIPLLVVFSHQVKNFYSKSGAPTPDGKPFYEQSGFQYINYYTVEEPELNLFPETQHNIIKYIISRLSLWANDINKFTKQLILTTHSPYILSSLNNLMYAHQIGMMTEDKEFINKVKDIIDPQFWLDPNDVSCYLMKNDGSCVPIIDEETKLIDAIKIDGVSEILNEQFDKLMALELDLEK